MVRSIVFHKTVSVKNEVLRRKAQQGGCQAPLGCLRTCPDSCVKGTVSATFVKVTGYGHVGSWQQRLDMPFMYLPAVQNYFRKNQRSFMYRLFNSSVVAIKHNCSKRIRLFSSIQIQAALIGYIIVYRFLMFTVVSALTWPIMADSVLMSIPFSSAMVAKVWRRSWNRTRLQFARSSIFWNRW